MKHRGVTALCQQQGMAVEKVDEESCGCDNCVCEVLQELGGWDSNKKDLKLAFEAFHSLNQKQTTASAAWRILIGIPRHVDTRISQISKSTFEERVCCEKWKE
ncbi:hypothetical protein PoB_007603100 [Plakobranchus ocellatus]|uniref:Uncharacterized protein n=1 Tax=Plakobranchus ocellatus TaxID=259542 RepID=A0AAV4E094_9GAST|nr:hypothetical protein PoB_007603100 [Plakobranchus ocellatus]